MPFQATVAKVPEAFARVQAGLPPTESAPVNVGLGAATVAATAGGAAWATEDHTVIGISAFLNLAAQFIKMPKWLNQNRWLIPILFILGLGASWVVFNGDHAKAFMNASIGTLKAIADYQADKLAGTRILASAAPIV